MINKLHAMVHTGIPSFSDLESVTTIEVLQRLTEKQNEIVDAYNKLETNLTKLVNDYKDGIEADFTVFTTEMRQEFQDFIDVVNLKVMGMQNEIATSITFISENLGAELTRIVDEMMANGDIGFSLFYDAEEENLTIAAVD